jgi:hypothetical protein
LEHNKGEDVRQMANRSAEENQFLKVMPFIFKRNIQIYLKHLRNEIDEKFELRSKTHNIESRHDIIICEILESKKFYIVFDEDYVPKPSSEGPRDEKMSSNGIIKEEYKIGGENRTFNSGVIIG